MTIEALAASMRHAFIERKGATIGGGKFTPEELKEGAQALKSAHGTRHYTLALTDMGCEQEEHATEDARSAFLEAKDNTEDDWYCLDVTASGDIDFYLADVG